MWAMEVIAWVVFYSLSALMLTLMVKVGRMKRKPRRPRPPAIHGPPNWKPRTPKPVPSVQPVGYLRRWTGRRRALVIHDHDLWQEDFDLLEWQGVARRAGGLHSSSTAAPVSGGEGVPPQGSEPSSSERPGGRGEAGASGEPPGRKNRKIWEKLSSDLSALE